MNKVNVLVTGANGFIGKNFIKKLSIDKNINILKITRDTSSDDFKNLILQSDFIYHFAGEVRPNSSDQDFKKSNTILTKEIVNILEENSKYIPILVTSSIHAKLLKNEYGKTKRESELIIEEYSKKNNIQCFIYRLPHAFGEWCKANYNSVISTWIYNSINNLDINVFDRDIKMNYVYVQDIVVEFIHKLKSKESDLYIEPKDIYETTLGDVVDYINEFKANMDNMKFNIENNEFKSKLYNTYINYYKELANDK